MKHLVLMGGIFGLLGVAIGAFGAHALKATLAANDTATVFQTGVQYQMAHALALLALAALADRLARYAVLDLICGLWSAFQNTFQRFGFLRAFDEKYNMTRVVDDGKSQRQARRVKFFDTV